MASDSLSAASTPLRPLHTNANDLCKVESSPIRLLPVPLLTQLKRRMLTRVLRARSSPASGLLARPTCRVWNPLCSALGVSSPRHPRSIFPHLSSGCLEKASLIALAAGSWARLLWVRCARHVLCRQENPAFLRAGLSGVPRVFFRGCLCHRIQVPIHVCGVGFCDTSPVSESSTQFWHHLPGGSMWSHRARAQSHKTARTSGSNRKFPSVSCAPDNSSAADSSHRLAAQLIC